MLKLCVVILNYRRTALTIDCLKSIASQIENHPDRAAVCIDNGSDDGSGEAIAKAIESYGWSSWLTFVASPINRGFAGGNNVGFQTIAAENYLLLNSDSRLTPGAISQMLHTLEQHPTVGAVGPRLQSVDGSPQISCFRYRSPMTEFLEAAGTGMLDRLFAKCTVPIGISDELMEPQWLSFACIMIRRAVIDQIGLMDEGYFMYFEDIDYSRRMRKAGWRILHQPQARAIHLRGGTSSVKKALRERSRVPNYYFQARSRYFAKFYGGRPGLWFTNCCWMAGRGIALAREWIERRQRSSCQGEALDNWTNWLRPFRPPTLQKGGEL